VSARVLASMILLVGSHSVLAEDQDRFLYLLPEGFSGWVCVDFGVVGAPQLPREGETRLIRVRPGEMIKASDKIGFIPPIGEARIQTPGGRQPLPEGVYGRRLSSRSDTKDPVARHCVFFGTEDAADGAGEAPGLETPPQLAPGIPTEERQALIALYDGTNGSEWTHRETTRVTRTGATYQVINYATAGPTALWTAQRAIEGVGAAVDWESVKSQAKCPGS
jgi:hypothetical protein